MGIVYYTDLYFIPLYFQNVRDCTPLLSGVMVLPLIVGLTIGSSTSGVLISRIGITNPVIRTGLVLWVSGAGGRISWHKDTHIAVLIICQLIEGIGVGCCFQPGNSTIEKAFPPHFEFSYPHISYMYTLRSRTHMLNEWQMYSIDRPPCQYRKG